MHSASSFPKVILLWALCVVGSWQCRQAPKAPQAPRTVTPPPAPEPPKSCGTPHSRTSVLLHQHAAPDTVASTAAAGAAPTK